MFLDGCKYLVAIPVASGMYVRFLLYYNKRLNTIL